MEGDHACPVLMTKPPTSQFEFYEFFAGGGMARLGLGRRWRCLMANDICPKKARAYHLNFGPAREFLLESVANLTLTDLPGKPDLIWASFPCQDLSLAGERRGFKGARSSTFWPFWRLVQGLARERRPAPIVVLENVVGAISSNAGADFQAILSILRRDHYRFGPMVIDAVHFVPQSRPRLFIVAVHESAVVEARLGQSSPDAMTASKSLETAYTKLPPTRRKDWIWWKLQRPRRSSTTLADLVLDDSAMLNWNDALETQRLLAMMSPVNLAKVRGAQSTGRRMIGAVYKRTRSNGTGGKVQRAEVRFDQISGCLRTPAGGSSRQTLLMVQGQKIRSRLLAPREAARLMGAPESYQLPDRYNEAYHLMGDGLVAPVVSWLEAQLLFPIARATRAPSQAK